MSASNNARALYARIMNDAGFRSQLDDNSSPEKIVARIMEYGKAHDIPVSAKEVRDAMKPPEANYLMRNWSR